MRLFAALAAAAIYSAAGQSLEPGYADINGGSLIRVHLALNVSEDAASELRCRFSGHTVPAVLHPDRSSVSCMAPPAPDGRPGSVGVSVTAMNRPLGSELMLAYYDSVSLPRLSSVTPRAAHAGKPTEVRIRGSNFAPVAPGEMKCRFRGEGLTNASFVSHEEMLCLSPLAADDTDDLSRTVPLQLSLDGDLFSLMGEVEFTIESHLPSNVTAIVPSHGPTDGHTEIEVHGVGFHPFIEDGEEVPIACHFHNDNRWHREVVATFVSSHLVKCSTPSYTETDRDGWHGDVALSVGPMGQQHGTWHEESNEVLFGYYILGGRPLPLSLSPAAGDFGHPPALSLEGQGFSPTGDDLACIYGDPSGDTTTAASFISAHEVHCAAPHTLPLGAIEVSATTDGGLHIGPDPGMHPNYKPPQLVVYDASKPPEVTGVSPTWAPINGGTEVVVRGSNLAPTHRLACVFERNGVAAATFLNETAVSCPTPLNARVGATLLSLTLDRATLSPGAVPVDLVDTDSPPRVLMVVPPLSTFHGGEMLTLWGDNFAPHLSTVCVFTIEPEDEGEERFTAATVAEFRSANKIKCESPFSGDARGTARVQVWNADVPRGTDVVRAALRTLEEAQTHDQGPRLSTTAGRLTYYNPDELPRVRSVTPDFAPASNDYGGHHVTVRGSNFAPVGNTLLCEFGETGTETFVASVHASFINGSALGCHIASNLIPGDIRVRVSLDGGKSFSLESARFTYYEPQHPPIVTAVSPREIDLADPPPHLVEIRGQNFAPTANLSCGFGAAREVGANAHFDSFHQIKCEVPPLAWEHNLVDTTTDGVRWSGQSMMWDPNADEMLGDSGIKKVPHPGHIVIFNSSKTGLLESVFPTALKIGTTKLLTIRGYNLYSKAKSGRCTFTPHDRSFGVDVPEPTAATAIDAEHVQCEAPHATEPQTLSLSIELDGHAGGFKAAPGPLGDGHLTLSFYDPSYPPGIDDSSPHFGERHEPSVVRLFGHNFAPAYAYKDDDRIHHAGVLMCRFGKLHSFTHATFVHSHAVLCPTPYTEHLGHVELGYSYDHGQSWVPTPEHVNYTFIDSDFPPEIKSVTPNVDMFDGGALLTVRGDNFYPEVDDSALHLARQHMEHGHQVLAGSLGGFVRGSNTQPLFGRRLLELASRLTFADPPAREMTPPHADPSGGWGAVLHADMSAEEHTSRYEKLLRRDAHGAVDYSKGNELVPAAEAHPSSGRQLSRRELAMIPQQFCLLSKPNGWPLAMSAATFISDTEVRCESPRVEDKSVADVNFHLISKNGVRSLPLPFTLWDPDTNPAVTSVFPQGIPVGTAASALVQVRGSGFAPIGEPMCRFGDDGEPTPATIVRSTLALCKTPPDSGGAARSVPVRVTRDGANSESDEDTLFSFYDPTSLPSTVAAVPPYADRHGGQTVVVSGAGIQPLGAELLCRVGGEDGIEVPAEFISMEKVRCMLPPAPAEWDGEEAWASVCVVHAGSAPAGCTAHVEFYDPHSPPVLQKLAPRLLPLHSETDEPLHVFGLNMAPMGDKLLCSFDGGSPVPASFVKGDEVKCTAPDSSEAKAIYVSVSIDGGQQFSEPLPFVRFDKDRPPMLKSLDPLYAPLHTPVEVTLYGDNFAPTPDFRCVFGHLEPTPATFISPKEARCFSPDIVHDPYTAYVKAELMADGPWSNSKPFTMYDDTRPPHVKNFSKHWGSVDGGEITDLFGDDFAPTEHLRTRFGAEDSQVVNYGPATFVTVNHIKVEIPRYHEPATVEVYATNDGEEYGSGKDWYDHKPVMYTYYNPREPPKVYSMAPKYGHHAVGTVVTINGYNFAPIPERLNVRWGSLGEDQATFVESGTVLAMSILPSAEVLSLSVPVQVAPTTMLVPPEAEWITEDLFTYWQPYLPPGLSSASPTEGACFSGGRKVEDTRTSDLTEVSNEETVEVEGFNFVPAEHLSCVYHHVGGSGMGGVDDYQVFLPGIFVRYDKIRCPIPTIRYADDGTSLSRIMWLTVTNDGITYRYSHTKFTFTGECRPTKFTTIVFGLITGLLVLLLGACLLGGGGGGKSQPQTRDFRFQQLDDDEPAPPQTTGPSRLDQIKAGTAGAMGSMANMAKAGAQKAKAYSEQLKQPPAPAPPPAQSTPAATRQFAAAPAPPPPAPPPQQYTPKPAPAPVPAPAPARVPSVPASPARDPEARLKQQGTLTVHVKEAKNLVGRDKANLSDPYVAIKIKGQKTWKSSVFKRNCNPQFDDRFVAKGTLGDFVNCLMLLKVIDRNTKELKEGYGGEKSDSLGDLSFKLDGLRTRNRVPYENVDLDMTESGTISLIVTWEADEQSLSI